MNLLAILVKGEIIDEWKKLRAFICNLHLIDEAKRAQLDPKKVQLIEEKTKAWNISRMAVSFVCKALGEIDILTFIDARLRLYKLEQG